MEDMGTITNPKVPTAKDLAVDLARQNPKVRIAYDTLRNAAIGAWDTKAGKFIAVIALTIDGRWAKMPFEVLANGQLPVREWVEVTAN